MIDKVYDELKGVLESNKDKTKTYALVMLGHDGNCFSMSNGNPMELCFMAKTLDGLYEETVRRAQAQVEASKVVSLTKDSGRPLPLPPSGQGA